ncbi:RhoGAP-domain-containing protein [Coemansia reversa NRRL 1564]|uniref:RhoGAP-domain-containing protein n=1 Tax=Coemansia reversa (strain ATCC 12441 / NRRL 1564) TaxID=763665 RepID=A0A2G5BIF5_COERN|nr:RhoGAP-domain-containing protein [Coemansia reversa NRRL 1564]|eukprot:PIA18786.1 RhoGAP-domain-containing protein [Coemansia reversa NRRL 1564]
MQGDDGGRLLNYVNANVIFQAGVDYESKPMVVFCACNLPSPKEVDYDRLLNLIIFRLDEFVENDYTVVMLTSGAQYNPGWSWLTKAYRRLDRKYRKNVKNVYVVHPSMWSKFIFQVFGRIVSPKFFAKVTWVDTLSQLAALVPLSQINIPQPVYEHNMKVEDRGVPTTSTALHTFSEQADGESEQIFGKPLSEFMADGLITLPRPVRESIAFIRHNGLSTDGLFRRSPPSTSLRAAKSGYNRGQNVDLYLAGVHVAAVLLKLFFRELPTPVFSSGDGSCSYDIVRSLPASKKEQEENTDVDVARQMDNVRIRYVKEVILPTLSQEYRQLLCFVCALLNVVARNESTNRMSSYNLAVVFAPNMARSNNPVEDVSMCGAGPEAATVGGILQIMIQHFDQVFVVEIAKALGGPQRVENVDDVAIEILNVVDLMNRPITQLSDTTKIVNSDTTDNTNIQLPKDSTVDQNSIDRNSNELNDSAT